MKYTSAEEISGSSGTYTWSGDETDGVIMTVWKLNKGSAVIKNDITLTYSLNGDSVTLTDIDSGIPIPISADAITAMTTASPGMGGSANWTHELTLLRNK